MHVNNTDKQASQALIEYANDDDDVDERQGTHAHAHTTYAYLRTEPLFDGIRGCVCAVEPQKLKQQPKNHSAAK